MSVEAQTEPTTGATIDQRSQILALEIYRSVDFHSNKAHLIQHLEIQLLNDLMN